MCSRIDQPYTGNRMKNNDYHTVGTIPKPNIKIVERDKTDTPNTKLHDRSSSWFGTGTSLQSCEVKLVLRAQASPQSEMMR